MSRIERPWRTDCPRLLLGSGQSNYSVRSEARQGLDQEGTGALDATREETTAAETMVVCRGHRYTRAGCKQTSVNDPQFCGTSYSVTSFSYTAWFKNGDQLASKKT